MSEIEGPQPTKPKPVLTGLAMKCPFCGKGKLFQGFLTLRKSCDHCQADFEVLDSGDGPAFFVMFLVSVLVVVPAIFVEIAYQPPYWVYVAFFLPLGLLLSLVFLRPFKGVMVALQVHFKAHQGEADTDSAEEI